MASPPIPQIPDYPDPDIDDVEDGDCARCDGDGWITADCFEDTCCCADPDEEHGSIPCPECNVDGQR